MLESFAGFLADGVTVFEEVALGVSARASATTWAELVEFVAGDPHRTALYFAGRARF